MRWVWGVVGYYGVVVVGEFLVDGGVDVVYVIGYVCDVKGYGEFFGWGLGGEGVEGV